MAEVLKAKLRRVDSIARWGGEEFLLLLPQTTSANAIVAAKKIGLEIKQDPLRYKGQEIAVTITFGISEFTKGMSVDDFLRGIDEALYSGKEQGKDRIISVPIVQHRPPAESGEHS